ncbi:hypothetical protein [Kribbella sp. NPDC048915]|uniref:hypothetical protein n=1 Tax=Kribbella sp. NPDC048915 TaxID=3155148 RepID=UPI0033D62DC7
MGVLRSYEDADYSPEDGVLVVRDVVRLPETAVRQLERMQATRRFTALAERTPASEDEVLSTLGYAEDAGLLAVRRLSTGTVSLELR